MRRLLLLLAGLTLLGTTVAAEPFVIVRDGHPVATVVLGEEASWQDRHAAEELIKYVELMTEARLARMRESRLARVGPQPRILLGRSATNAAIADLVQRGLVDLSADRLGEEGFIIKTVLDLPALTLVLGGSQDLGTLYAVCELLERFGRVGFFRYEEHVPRRKDFVIPETDLVWRPFFRERMYGGQVHYFGIHWWDEAGWQEEMDWCAKHRINGDEYIPGPVEGQILTNRAWARLGFEVPDPPSREVGALALKQRVAQYGLRLGVRGPIGASKGRIPAHLVEQFRQKYPQVRTISSGHGMREALFVHPAEPLWKEMSQVFIRTYTEAFGNTGLFSLPSYGETALGDTEQEKEEFTREYARALGELSQWVQENLGAATWKLGTWSFNNRQYWTLPRVKRLLDMIPPEVDLVLWDLMAESEPVYVSNEYWFGHKWAYQVFLGMGGNTHVHGDIGHLLGEVSAVLRDQRAIDTLVGFGWVTEARDYAPLYQDLVLQIMKGDPIGFNLDDFLLDYAERRYGERDAEQMVRVLKKELTTVYGPRSEAHMRDGFITTQSGNPCYWFGQGTYLAPFNDELRRRTVFDRADWGPTLLSALEEALVVADRQTGNPAYDRDLVDIMRSYVQVEMNLATWRLVEAYQQGDEKTFAQQAQKAERLFQYLLAAIGTVPDRWEFSVAALEDIWKRAPNGKSGWQVRNFLYYVTFSRDPGGRIHNYARSDRYEMVRDLYWPMYQTFLQTLRERFAAGERELPDDDFLRGLYGPIEEQFIEGPCPPPPTEHPTAAEVSRQFLAAARRGEI